MHNWQRRARRAAVEVGAPNRPERQLVAREESICNSAVTLGAGWRWRLRRQWFTLHQATGVPIRIKHQNTIVTAFAPRAACIRSSYQTWYSRTVRVSIAIAVRLYEYYVPQSYFFYFPVQSVRTHTPPPQPTHTAPTTSSIEHPTRSLRCAHGEATHRRNGIEPLRTHLTSAQAQGRPSSPSSTPSLSFPLLLRRHRNGEDARRRGRHAAPPAVRHALTQPRRSRGQAGTARRGRRVPRAESSRWCRR